MYKLICADTLKDTLRSFTTLTLINMIAFLCSSFTGIAEQFSNNLNKILAATREELNVLFNQLVSGDQKGGIRLVQQICIMSLSVSNTWSILELWHYLNKYI